MNILSILIGFVVGVLLFMIINITRNVGYLRIDTTNPDKDVYLIDISKDLNKLPKKKSILLKIDPTYKKTQ